MQTDRAAGAASGGRPQRWRRWSLATARSANYRLHQRWQRLDARGKRSTVSAVAGELAGWCWSLAVMEG